MSSVSAVVYVGSDHAGFRLKEECLTFLRQKFPDIKFEDCGCHSEDSVDYPTVAANVAEKVAGAKGRGILLCGSGIGVAIAANRTRGVRAATVWDVTSARLSREHNDANIVCVGSRLLGVEVIKDICATWLSTSFLGGRHQRRVDLMG